MSPRLALLAFVALTLAGLVRGDFQKQTEASLGFKCEHSEGELMELRHLKNKALEQGDADDSFITEPRCIYAATGLTWPVLSERIELQEVEAREHEKKLRAEGQQWQRDQDAKAAKEAKVQESKEKRHQQRQIDAAKDAAAKGQEGSGTKETASGSPIFTGDWPPPACPTKRLNSPADLTNNTVYYYEYSKVHFSLTNMCV